MKVNDKNSRRDFLKKTSILAIAGIVAPSLSKAIIETPTAESVRNTDGVSPFTLPALPYSYDALEPHIDKMTMEIHHTKHHQAYVDKLNKALDEVKVSGISLENICKNISKYSTAIRNNAGGHFNHALFWKLMKPNGSGVPSGTLADAIKTTYGSFDDFKNKFNDAAKNRFGSGWTWVVVNKDKKLEIGSTPNQDNPLMDISDLKGTPILALDVWEHAYYLKYQNKRPDYINAWWNLVNWEEAGKNFTNAI